MPRITPTGFVQPSRTHQHPHYASQHAQRRVRRTGLPLAVAALASVAVLGTTAAAADGTGGSGASGTAGSYSTDAVDIHRSGGSRETAREDPYGTSHLQCDGAYVFERARLAFPQLHGLIYPHKVGTIHAQRSYLLEEATFL